MKTYIHPNVSGETRNQLAELLKEAGCEIVEDLDETENEEGDPEIPTKALEEACDHAEVEAGGESESRDVPACVVVLTPGLVEGDLEPGLSHAVARGCRVIGVWGADADGDVSPLGDYGSDTVPWDVGRVRDAICGVPQHLNPAGNAMPRKKSAHGGC